MPGAKRAGLACVRMKAPINKLEKHLMEPANEIRTNKFVELY